MNNYDKIATAIDYIKSNFKTQPDLQEVAAAVHMSPFHFQRVFSEWAGVTPKKFLQYLTLDYAKGILREEKTTVFDAAFEAGLSGTGRLHDLFINIESMTPGEYKNGGKALHINYSFAESPFGNILVASTAKGICHMAFADQPEAALQALKEQFPHAEFMQMVDVIQQNTLYIFTQDWSRLSEIKLHLRGTDFQLKVWEALLKIPMGNLTTYSRLAEEINHPRASRAVGTAVAQNPVAFLIPCHRVIKASGEAGQYHWGISRKNAMIGWEAARTQSSGS
ncbi:AraC family transcriptional regulator of adaptative response/methylated-DNA-[protein]-cysteine methyltransferase [Chitinophaga polysaccharea]|uniref:methylated-DNA--[protein]-cysteine S-methyltransferase n=1 Tax=Chitinophaga polysaccharea TaxID=1293035 RepID=A0A561Q5M9_9BACT|nr:methylated-DNA--[protein]-cysteine S-methyltransferase [Chitinophaga polysaccharea]TWF45666.1 AraC family transcriptional regulator of adaptative response/methylated-DNA-[protein]-cysteine methyltransferase [Chitinophaga polysaccharea]